MTISKSQKKELLNGISLAVKTAVEIQINGNLRDIKSHLNNQDIKIEKLDKKIDEKIKPFSTTRDWIIDTGKIIIYLGVLATGLYYIIKLLNIK